MSRKTASQIKKTRHQANAKRKGARLKLELRAGFDVETLKADGYKLVGFEEE